MSQVVAENEVRHSLGERFNLAPNSRNFDCKFIEPGFVSYRDVGGHLELLRKETLDRCMASTVGNALIIGHTNVSPENRADLEHGIIHEWYYNAEDGWYYVKGTAETESAVKRIKDGWKPSCGYKVRELGEGGMDHGIRYDQEILDLEFNHLAIVERPRYAGSDFRLNHQKSSMSLSKFFKRIVTKVAGADGNPVETVKTESAEIPADAEIEYQGQKYRLNELVAAYPELSTPVVAGEGDEVEIDGKPVKVSVLAAAHKAKVERTNAAPAKVVAPAVTETPEQKAAREADEAKTKRENELAFQNLQGARFAPVKGGYSTTSGSLKEKVELGSKRY